MRPDVVHELHAMPDHFWFTQEMNRVDVAQKPTPAAAFGQGWPSALPRKSQATLPLSDVEHPSSPGQR
jgi:hypothetical protein